MLINFVTAARDKLFIKTLTSDQQTDAFKTLMRVTALTRRAGALQGAAFCAVLLAPCIEETASRAIILCGSLVVMVMAHLVSNKAEDVELEARLKRMNETAPEGSSSRFAVARDLGLVRPVHQRAGQPNRQGREGINPHEARVMSSIGIFPPGATRPGHNASDANTNSTPQSRGETPDSYANAMPAHEMQRIEPILGLHQEGAKI